MGKIADEIIKRANANRLSHTGESHYGRPVYRVGPSASRAHIANSGSSPYWSPLINKVAEASMLPIRCKDLQADLHKEKFGSGSKSKCVMYKNYWITLSEFESISGIGSGNWKQNVRFIGHPLQTLIDKRFLVPHNANCTCHLCEEQSSDLEFIKPSKPNRKHEIEDIPVASGQSKSRPFNSTTKSPATTIPESSAALMPASTAALMTVSSVASIPESSAAPIPVSSAALMPVYSATTVPVSKIADAFNPASEALIRIKHLTFPLNSKDAWKVVEDAAEDIVMTANSVKALVCNLKKNAGFRPQQDQVRAEPVADCPGAFRAFTNTSQSKQGKAQEHSSQVMNPNSYESAEDYSYQDGYLVFKCENCGQDGFLHCTGCHIVPYCSTACQQSDWHRHQFSCLGELLRQTQS